MVAAGLKRLFAKPPKELVLAGFHEKEEKHPGVTGVEMYAPAHHYHYHGGGTVEGHLEKLLSFHKKLARHEFVEVRDITLEH